VGFAAGLLAALALAGCGGSSAGGTAIGGGNPPPGSPPPGNPPGGKPVTINSGPLTLTSAIALPPITLAGRNAAIVGFAGGAISNVTVKLPPLGSTNLDAALGNTLIAYDEGGQTKIYNFGSKVSIPIGQPNPNSFSSTPSFSGVGNRLAVAQRAADGQTNQVFVENVDGSSRVGVGAAFVSRSTTPSPAYSPDGSKVAYVLFDSNFTTHLAMAPAGGGAPTIITSGPEIPANPVWTPDGKTIVYASLSATGGGWRIKTFAVSTGGTPLSATPAINGPAPTITFLGGDSGDMVLSYQVDGMSCINRFHAGLQSLLSHNGDTINGISGSPIGKFLLIGDTTKNTINMLNCDDATLTQVPLITGNGIVQSPNWGPYSATKTLVGPGGAFGSTSGAILYGAAGPTVGGIVSVDATTESSIAVQAQSNPNPTQSIIFATVTGTNLTTLKYVNNLNGAVVTAFSGASPGVSNALVSFDADTGDVLSVVTSSSGLARSRGSFSGKILGAFDATGRNLAPNGARSVSFDEHSGKLLSVR